MNLTIQSMIFAFLLAFVGGSLFCPALADHDGHGNHRHGSIQNDHHGSTIQNNALYSEQCGACHFAYPPQLLPSKSWESLLSSLENHFGETVEMGPESEKEISEYLRKNAADYASVEVSEKIVKSLDGKAPERITDIPFIIRKHKEISKEELRRNSIGSLSNCSACHTKAEKGIFDDDENDSKGDD
jgi:hypothetical protein